MGEPPFGTRFFINRYVAPYDANPEEYHSLGGIPKPVRAGASMREIMEPGTGQRKLTALSCGEIRFPIEVTLLVQQLDNYLRNFAMRLETEIVGEHILRWTDGIDQKEAAGCKVGRCELRARHGGMMTADLGIAAKDIQNTIWEANPFLTLPNPSLTYKALTVLSIDVTELPTWTEVALIWNHHLEEVSCGVDPKPSDIGEGEAEFRLEVILLKKQADYLQNVRDEVILDAGVQITDTQTVPKTTTFTLKDCLTKLSRLEVPGLGAMAERVELIPHRMEIATV